MDLIVRVLNLLIQLIYNKVTSERIVAAVSM